MSCLRLPRSRYFSALMAALVLGSAVVSAAPGEPTPALRENEPTPASPEGSVTPASTKFYRARGWSDSDTAGADRQLRWVRPTRYQEADDAVQIPPSPFDPAPRGFAPAEDTSPSDRPLPAAPPSRPQPGQHGAEPPRGQPEELSPPAADEPAERSLLRGPGGAFSDGDFEEDPSYYDGEYGPGAYDPHQPYDDPAGCGPQGCGPNGCGVDNGCGGEGRGGNCAVDCCCQGSCCDCFSCCSHPGYWDCCWCSWCWWENLSVFAGPAGFKGPLDLGRNGSFGFSEGLNWSMPLFPHAGIGAQFGFRAVQSNFSGNSIEGGGGGRDQLFATLGLFRRTHCGFQYGIAADFLEDDYYDDISVSQYRGEFSLIHPSGHEVGFYAAFGGESDQGFIPPIVGGNTFPLLTNWEATDQYALFYRYTMCDGGSLKLYAGGTSQSGGLVGGDLRLPLSCRWAFASNFAYASAGSGDDSSYSRESWGLGASLEFFPGCVKGTGNYSWLRPLFNVADNSTFFVKRE